MTYVILLDAHQNDYGADQYAISDFGTLAYCRAQTRTDGTTLAAPKSHYDEGASEPKSLLDPQGHVSPGRIVELTPKVSAGKKGA